MDSHLSNDSDGPSFVILDPGLMSLTLPDSMETSSKTNHSSVIDIEKKLESLIKENNELKETLIQNNQAMKSQFETLSMWQRDVFATHQNHKEKFAETRELILRLRSENSSLKDKMKVQETSSENCSKCQILEDQLLNSQQYIKKLEAEIYFLGMKRDSLIADYSKLQIQLRENSLYHSGVSKSLDDKASFNSMMSGRRLSAEKNGLPPALPESWLRMDSHVNEPALRKDYKDLQVNFETVTKQCVELKEENEKLNADVSRLEKQLDEKETILKSAIDELNLKRDKVTELEAQRDELGILKTQVEVYRCDYQEERSARESLVGEKESMAEEIRKLTHEIGELRQRILAPPTEGNSCAEAPAAAPTDVSRPYSCPVCQLRFASAEDCNVHVNECLDQPMRP